MKISKLLHHLLTEQDIGQEKREKGIYRCKNWWSRDGSMHEWCSWSLLHDLQCSKMLQEQLKEEFCVATAQSLLPYLQSKIIFPTPPYTAILQLNGYQCLDYCNNGAVSIMTEYHIKHVRFWFTTHYWYDACVVLANVGDSVRHSGCSLGNCLDPPTGKEADHTSRGGVLCVYVCVSGGCICMHVACVCMWRVSVFGHKWEICGEWSKFSDSFLVVRTACRNCILIPRPILITTFVISLAVCKKKKKKYCKAIKTLMVPYSNIQNTK